MDRVSGKFLTAPTIDAVHERSLVNQVYLPLLLFAACVVAQLYLVFSKSFNWDEFLHFSVVYQLRAGTPVQPFQVFHLRMLWWAPDVATNLVDQMLAARIFAWTAHLFTLAMIYGIARQFFDATNSRFAAFAYMSAGFVFTQSFSIRSDPFVTATLMCALFIMARGKLSLIKAIAIGALVGLAGMMTMKAIFYTPCFAGLAWIKFREAPSKSQLLGKLAVAAVSAVLSFWAVYEYHTWDSPAGASAPGSSSLASYFLRWMTTDQPFKNYIAGALILGVVFFASVILSPIGWKRVGLAADKKIALIGFLAPFAVLPFYRNTFPYFFTFLLAPVAVTIAPALGMARARYGNAFLAFVLAAVPLALAILEPRGVLRSQRALIDYVHQEFPEKTGYLDYSGMIADYPRIIRHLTSGNGIRGYFERGDPIVAREIKRGNVPFIIANEEMISALLEDRPPPEFFLPADWVAIRGNYVRQWSVLWREGRSIPVGADTFEFRLGRSGSYVLDGSRLTVDGTNLAHGESIRLSKGRHRVTGLRVAPSTLWRGNKLPTPPPNLPMDIVFTKF